jgi:hypothetical protein
MDIFYINIISKYVCILHKRELNMEHKQNHKTLLKKKCELKFKKNMMI